ncbi:MBL fold metallo-hydrolase [Lacicoccus qingdaonensis]|uniref:Glyoxylase, beta-lactamase superfamily II n=1 Tax=Lacicoccus qingdaonensis TaxID=576118 RepID=A0A1G9EY63_9BACL|nr:MBL fold metallo-hydrolase [Salinicoccus qingdaonensis]SDK81051.1 Glyoxylase, beta-lactamase superfamily II [Salinicoccus qingdaonensis]
MNVKTLSLGQLGTNCYVISNGEEVLIVDPAAEAEVIFEAVEEINLPVTGILLTHAHYDHIGALDEVQQKYDTDVYMASEEKEWIGDPNLNMSIKRVSMGIEPIESDIEPVILQEGDYSINSFNFEIFHTPGHSPGSLSFYFKEEQKIFSGDVLFNGGVGRTDLLEGSFDVLMKSIKNKLFQLDDGTAVYPGHGNSTSIEKEKQTNPYIF